MDEHENCDVPATGLPGERWTCLVCLRVWEADEIEIEYPIVAIVWELVGMRKKEEDRIRDIRHPYI